MLIVNYEIDEPLIQITCLRMYSVAFRNSTKEGQLLTRFLLFLGGDDKAATGTKYRIPLEYLLIGESAEFLLCA